VAERLVADPVAWFTSERLNLIVAAKRAGASGWHQLAIELASCQGGFQYLQNRNDDATQLWSEVVDAATKGEDSMAVADAQFRYAAALIERGQASDAKDLLDGCVENFDRTGDKAALSYALYWRSSCELDLGLMAVGMGDAERGVALSRLIGNRHAEFLNLRPLSWALVSAGQYEKALEICECAVSVARELGEESYEMTALRTLSYICTLVGQHDRALAIAQRLLTASRQLGDVRGEGVALGAIGDAYHGLGRYQEAKRALSEALPIFHGHANRRYHALCLLKLGYACEQIGEHGMATEYLEASLRIFRELRLTHYEDRARKALARSRIARSAVSSPG
jgi:tetratricopeptide (TPR) repeat protein